MHWWYWLSSIVLAGALLVPGIARAQTFSEYCALGSVTGAVLADGLNCGGNRGLSSSAYRHFRMTLAGDVTLDVANLLPGLYTFQIAQDVVGGHTVTFGVGFLNATPVLTDPEEVTWVTAVWNGSQLVQIASTNPASTVTCDMLPALTGDVETTAGSCEVTLTGGLGEATHLAVNGTNCSAGEFAAGVDDFGVAEGCTALPLTIAGTSGNLTASGATGAITLDVGATVVQTDQANTWTTGAQDFGSATSLKVPTGAGKTATVNGTVAYDSTANMLHAGQGGADAFVPQFTVTPGNDECVKWVVSGSNYTLGTAGEACGAAGGSGDFSSNTATSVDSEIVLFSGTGGKTGKRATGTGLATVTSGVLGTVTAPSGTVVGTSDAQTLTNKRINPRVVTLTDQATVTINSDTTDVAVLDSLSQATEFADPTGTPVDGQSLILRITSAASQSLTWGTAFSGGAGSQLPETTTGGGVVDYLGFKRNDDASTWDFVAASTGGGSGAAATVERLWLPMANCRNTTATLNDMWSLPASNPLVAACSTGTNIQKGVAAFADGSDLSGQTTLKLPSDWNGTLSAIFKWFGSGTTSDVKWQLQTACVADAETGDPAYNTASSVIDTAKGTANQLNDATISTVDVTGCAAGELLHVRLRRNSGDASDTYGQTANLVGIELSWGRDQ